jgi:hypothetical protein
MRPMPELAFLLPDSGSAGVADLVTALSREVGRQDAASLLCAGSPPPGRGDRVYVVFGGADEGDVETPEPARTISVLLAPPGSDRFEEGVELGRRAGAVFHVNSVATERLLELGLPARHLQLGYSVDWGGFDPETAPELAIVRDCGGYLDWPRVLDAIHRGAVVLHEQALGLAPLVAGRHLFVAAPEALDTVAAALRSDPARLGRVRSEALDFVRGALPLALAAAALVGAARALVAQPLLGTDSTPGQPVPRSR